MTLTLRNPSRMFYLFAILTACLIFVQVTGPLMRDVAQDISHRLKKHGAEAMTAQQCMDGRGGHLFHNPDRDRFGTVCEIDGRWGIVITDAKGNPITSFLREKSESFERVVQYMQRQGYGLVH
jgi:hypothetical protein